MKKRINEDTKCKIEEYCRVNKQRFSWLTTLKYILKREESFFQTSIV